MYIRWITRKHKNEHAAHMTFHDAYLVESYRDHNGKPRQRTLAYLGNIREIDEGFPSIERELFLLRAQAVIEGHHALSEEDHTDIMTQLHAKVPPLSHYEVIFAFQQNLRWFYQWCQTNNVKPPAADELQRLIASSSRLPEPF